METKVILNGFQLKRQAEKDGKFISIPFKYYGSKVTARQMDIRQMFNKYDFLVFDYYEAEEIIEYIREITDAPRGLHMPMDGDITFAVEFDNGITVIINAEDEYMGAGESSQGIHVSGVICEDSISNEAIDEVNEWLHKAFTIYK